MRKNLDDADTDSCIVDKGPVESLLGNKGLFIGLVADESKPP